MCANKSAHHIKCSTYCSGHVPQMSGSLLCLTRSKSNRGTRGTSSARILSRPGLQGPRHAHVGSTREDRERLWKMESLKARVFDSLI